MPTHKSLQDFYETSDSYSDPTDAGVEYGFVTLEKKRKEKNFPDIVVDITSSNRAKLFIEL